MANLDGISLGEATVRAQRIAKEILPGQMALRLAGEAESMRESGEQCVFIFGLAALVIDIVLAAQFESFTQPLIGIVALPFSMVGALGSLWAMGMSLNLFSMIGIVLLIGLVTKNSILLFNYANQLRREGLSAKEAIRKAAPIRMRRVLMTAVSARPC